MDDDEYDVYDDLDPQTLAALDQIEKADGEKRNSSANINPPPKRQKTDSGWRATGAPKNSSFDLDELPEISLCQNSYTFQQLDVAKSPSLTPQAHSAKDADRRAPVVNNARKVLKPQQVGRISHPQKPLSNASKAGFSKLPVNRPQQTSNAPPSYRPRNPQLLEKIAAALDAPSPHPLALERVPYPQPPAPRPPAPAPASLRYVPAVAVVASRTQTNAPSPSPAPPLRHTPAVASCAPTSAIQIDVPSSSPALPAILNDELNQFKIQLEKMRSENEKIQVSLKEAREAHMAKVGEVTVLRRGMQKTAEDHASQIAKFKSAKEEADAKQASMQRDLKEEMERLRTQFIFKAKLESNSRKVPASARKAVREVTGFTQSPFAVARASSAVTAIQSTPVRPSSTARLQARSPEKNRKSAILPGFENAFEESTPKRPLRNERVSISPEIHRPLFAGEFQSQGLPSKNISRRTESTFPDDGFNTDVDVPKTAPQSSPMADEDYGMEDDDDDDSMEEVHFKWKAELTRVILTHVHSSYTRPTLQLLAEQSSSVASSEEYSSQIYRIMEVIASTAIETDYDRAISIVARCMVSICFALNLSNLMLPLIPLLNLMSTLTYSFPSFNTTILGQDFENKNDTSILVLLCDIIIHRLDIQKHSGETLILATEVLSLTESFCWRTPEETIAKLDIVAQNRDVVMILVHSSQPIGFLVRATRLLIFMSIHPRLASSLLSLPTQTLIEETERASVQKIPQLDRLCSYLIDTKHRKLRQNVVTLFMVLSQAHSEALAALTSSTAVIPSLILYLTHMSSPIWEEDESLISSPSSISSTIRSLNQTTYLLHYLVFRFQPEMTLKLKLQHAPHRWFNGVAHMFIVTFGRLSYAPIPEWMELEKKAEFAAVRDAARELLELVVPGPEGDSVYKAYHDEEEDEGDMEEDLLGDA
ncbi:hypothetical protein D9757_000667 [Collybiopsis confluens]|uniref:Uncharacterized protein n=1 Tax=Collybiopsis confluens TaxID=2823264 RepID=A0A8H5I1Y9_9AGAR|nr:hypothetical protein D9757_000667 [Collybiopsis confluens]